MKRGFSLVELILALLLLQVGMLAVVGTIHRAQENFRRSELILRGVLEAARVADSLARSGATAPGRAAYRWGELIWHPASDPVPGLRVTALGARDGDSLAVFMALPPLPASGGSWPDSVAPEERW